MGQRRQGRKPSQPTTRPWPGCESLGNGSRAQAGLATVFGRPRPIPAAAEASPRDCKSASAPPSCGRERHDNETNLPVADAVGDEYGGDGGYSGVSRCSNLFERGADIPVSLRTRLYRRALAGGREGTGLCGRVQGSAEDDARNYGARDVPCAREAGADEDDRHGERLQRLRTIRYRSDGRV